MIRLGALPCSRAPKVESESRQCICNMQSPKYPMLLVRACDWEQPEWGRRGVARNRACHLCRWLVKMPSPTTRTATGRYRDQEASSRRSAQRQ